MKIHCKELNRDFDNDSDMFKALLDNKDRIISLKKAAVKFSDGIEIMVIRKGDEAAKALPELKDGYVYPIINTTKILDGHKDLHVDGLWNKTIQEQKGKIYYAINHELKIGSIVAYPKDVEVFTQELKWSDLGKAYEGSTEALIFKVNVQEYANKDAVAAIENKLPVQNSVSMRYVKIEFAVNSEDKEYKTEKAVFDTFYPMVANKADFEELKYFWVVKEAGIAKEGSMVPLGSNSETPILYPTKEKSDEPSDDTQENKDKKAAQALSDENHALVEALKQIINN